MTYTPEEQARHRGLVVAALRSGEFKQGHYAMQGAGKYCCLGVACRVAERHGVAIATHDDGSLVGGSLQSHEAVARWLGIRGRGLYGTHPVANSPAVGNGANSLAADNDDRKHTFRRIADTIERVWGTDVRPADPR